MARKKLDLPQNLGKLTLDNNQSHTYTQLFFIKSNPFTHTIDVLPSRGNVYLNNLIAVIIKVTQIFTTYA
jgi:hypothetical protein